MYRPIWGLLLAFVLMVTIPCLMPFDGFEHQPQTVTEENVVVAETSAIARDNAFSNPNLLVVAALTVIATVPAAVSGKYTQYALFA